MVRAIMCFLICCRVRQSGATAFFQNTQAQRSQRKTRAEKSVSSVSLCFKFTAFGTIQKLILFDTSMLVDKTYQGDLQATGTGRMLFGMTAVKGIAGYVAIERVEGTLKGAKGTFLIQL